MKEILESYISDECLNSHNFLQDGMKPLIGMRAELFARLKQHWDWILRIVVSLEFISAIIQISGINMASFWVHLFGSIPYISYYNAIVLLNTIATLIVLWLALIQKKERENAELLLKSEQEAKTELLEVSKKLLEGLREKNESEQQKRISGYIPGERHESRKELIANYASDITTPEELLYHEANETLKKYEKKK